VCGARWSRREPEDGRGEQVGFQEMDLESEWRENPHETARFEVLLERVLGNGTDSDTVTTPEPSLEVPASSLRLQLAPQAGERLDWESEADAAHHRGNEAFRARFLYYAWLEYTRALLSKPTNAAVYANRAQVDLLLAQSVPEHSLSTAVDWYQQARRDARHAWGCLGGSVTAEGNPDWDERSATASIPEPKLARLRWKVCLRYAAAARGLGLVAEADAAAASAQRLKLAARASQQRQRNASF
jgi:hypothetical protein